MSTKHLLTEEIKEEFEELSKIQVGTDEHKTAVDAITKLMDREIEIKKLELEERKAEDEFELEKSKNEIDEAKAENERKHNKTQNWLQGLGIAIPAGLTIWGTLKTIKFEETGTCTTVAGRNFFNRLFKK